MTDLRAHGRRRLPAAVVSLVLIGLAASVILSIPGREDAPRPRAATDAVASPSAVPASLTELACERVPREALLRTWRGLHPKRSGDIVMIPEEPNFVSGGMTHATPFDYTQEVPLFVYGPGYVRPGTYERGVTLADVAPTTAALLGFPFETREGRALTGALLPDDERPLPSLVVTLIWDSVGDNVLERWPRAWPVLRSLMPHGAWFENAVVGASPSNTPVSHATIGTGTFPRDHGLVDVYVRVDGEVREPTESGPQTLLEPTLADLYDVALGNEPVVGTIGTLSDHLMMMGHGASWVGGDRDLAVTREDVGGETTGVESSEWNLVDAMAPFYELPTYVNDLSPIERFTVEVDRADGALDGRWRDHDLAGLADGWDTPARSPYQQELVEAMIERESFGADDVPDLLFVNFKTTDKIGHLFTADGVEMADTVASQDAALGRLVEFLDEEVGPGRWVLILTADHGTQRDPDVTGAFMIDAEKLRAGLAAEFDDADDVPLVVRLRPSQLWLDRAELAKSDASVNDVARWMQSLTKGETFTGARAPDPSEADDRVFSAVLPASAMDRLPCLDTPTGR